MVRLDLSRSAGINLLIRMKQSYRGQAKQAANAIWGSSAAHVRYKHITVVDDDIDIHDYAAVDWAVAYRVNAGEDDIVIMPSTFGAGLDPSTRRRDRNPDLFGTGKWNRVLIDATINLDYDPDPELGGARFPPTVWPEKGDIEKAYALIHGQIVRTPIVYSQKLSRLCGCETYFKLENLQMTGSFKERGALNKLSSLSAEERSRGVIAASAGNHAQAVAYHCQRLGIKAKIFMPKGTPLIKVVSTQGYGAEVILHGEMVDDASDLALEISRKEGSFFLHPFNDPGVIAGQGTIAKEILEDEQGRTIDAVVCPVGGGGLISGIATYLKETAPRIAVIGVQAAACPSMKKSLEAGHPLQLEKASSLADGIAIKRVEPLNFSIIRKYVDEIVTVDEDQIANAVLLLLEMEKTVSEGAGAVALAAVLSRKVNLPGKKVLLIISGGNIDVNILDKIITRGLAVAGRVTQLILRIRDLPGSLMAVLEIIKKRQVNILDIMHHRYDSTAPFGYVDVSFTLETKGHPHIEEIKKALRESGYHPQSCLLGD